MHMKHKIGLTSKDQWNMEWEKWYEKYAKGYPRVGKWIEAAYFIRGLDILEIAAGSSRESIYLANKANRVVSADFSDGVINAIQCNNPPNNLTATMQDAFNLTFPSKSFNMTFHKGFWIYFEDDDIGKLCLEQLRVTKSFMLAFVHNARNKRMVEMFAKKGEFDPLFQVRFFDPYEIAELVRNAISKSDRLCKVRIRKYGGCNWLFKYRLTPVLEKIRDQIAPSVYNIMPWSNVEYVAVEILLTEK